MSLIANGQLYYRGRNAAALAQTAAFEQVAELLWLGDLPELGQANAGWAAAGGSPAPGVGWMRELRSAAPIEIRQATLAVVAARDRAAYDLRPASVVESARRIIRLMTAAAVFPAAPVGERVAETLQKAWAPGRTEARPLREAALILCADHELNVSAFTARCVASAGGTPYGVVLGRALGLPRGAALALFALGRSAGWMGHALEQYATGGLIRPRARYVGPAPAGE